MVIGVLQLALTIPEAMSLKDKRRAIKGLKDRLRSRHNVSVAEVDGLDEHRRSTVAISMISNDRRYAESCLAKIVDEVRRCQAVGLVNFDLELF